MAEMVEPATTAWIMKVDANRSRGSFGPTSI